MLANDGDAFPFIGVPEMGQDDADLGKARGDRIEPARQCAVERRLRDSRAVEVAGDIAFQIDNKADFQVEANLRPVFEALKPQADALYVVVDQLIVANLMRILTFALSVRLPMIFSTRDFVRSGGLMSYGPNYADLFGRSADYVDKILHGANPADMPVEQPTRFELVLNLTTARALGLKIPESFLLRADEVIE